MNRPSSSKVASSKAGQSKVVRPKSAAPAPKIPDYSKIKSSGVASQPAPYKIVSASLRKNVEDKRKLEQDNKTYERKLEAHKTNPIPLDEENKVLEEQRKIESEIIRLLDKETKNLTGSQLLEMLTQLKKDVGDSEKENEILKANLTKVTLAEKKYQIAIDNMNKFFGLNRETETVRDKYLDNNEFKSKLQREDNVDNVNNTKMDEFIDTGDRELNEMLEEHQALQDIRRGLITRIKASRDICKTAESVIDESIKRGQLMRERLKGDEGKSGDENGSSKLKKIQALKFEIATLEATRDNELHIGNSFDQIMEIKQVLNYIRDKVESVKVDITKIQDKRNEIDNRLKEFLGNDSRSNVIGNLYESHALMRSTLMRLRRQNKLERIEKGIDNLELDFLRHRFRTAKMEDQY